MNKNDLLSDDLSFECWNTDTLIFSGTLNF